MTNNEALRALWKLSGLSQKEMLDKINNQQSRPWGMQTLKAYMATPDKKYYRACTNAFFNRARLVTRIDVIEPF